MPDSLKPPQPKKIPKVHSAHGDVRIEDYYWLRDDTRKDPEVISYLEAENQYLEDKDPNKFIAKMGADALEALLSRLDLDELSYSLRHKANSETSQQRKT